jgi:thiol:disulfide interchange protein
MGTALGFALTQPAAVSLSVFAALGAGMAAPMVALSYSQRFRDIMPAPGAWMLTLRQILAFPLYLTVIWLLWIVGRQIGVDALAGLLVACVTLALGLWLWNKPGVGRIVAAASLLFTAVLSWQTLQAEPPANRASETFSRQALATLTAQSQPVFVDVTADWCITCIANEKAVLETQSIQSAFAARNVQYVVVDWTNYDPAIAEFLAEFNRNGIPFYLLYPGDDRAPTILPQILTHDIVLSALEKL